MAATALLIIDVQQALCFGEVPAYAVKDVIANLNAVAARVRAAKQLVVLIQHESATGVLARDTAGWQFAEGLDVQPTDFVVAKRATDSFHQTELLELLQQHGVKQLIIGGLQSEFCVDTTTRRALALGFPFQLIADGHTTVDNSVLSAAQIRRHHNETLANIGSFGPRARAVLAAEISI